MTWYKTLEWQNCLELFDSWWFDAWYYVDEVVYLDHQFREQFGLEEFRQNAPKLVDALIDTAHLDPMPVWDVTRLIQNDLFRYEDITLSLPTSAEEVSISVVEDRLQQVQMLRDRCERVGLSDSKPEWAESSERKIKPRKKARDILTDILAGHGNEVIAEKHCISATYVTTIRHRYDNDEYDLKTVTQNHKTSHKSSHE